MEIFVYTEITFKNLAPKKCFNFFFKYQILDLLEGFEVIMSSVWVGIR